MGSALALLLPLLVTAAEPSLAAPVKPDQPGASPQIKAGHDRHVDKGLTRKKHLDVRALRKEADKGVTIAQVRLGTAYNEGEGVPRDHAEALRWFMKAAEQSDADARCAQCLLGLAYREGDGVPQDYAEAVLWFTKSADHGYAPAQCFLGNAYSEGQGGCHRTTRRLCAGSRNPLTKVTSSHNAPSVDSTPMARA